MFNVQRRLVHDFTEWGYKDDKNWAKNETIEQLLIEKFTFLLRRSM